MTVEVEPEPTKLASGVATELGPAGAVLADGATEMVEVPVTVGDAPLDPEPEPVPLPAPKVELMGPTLMFEKTTYALGLAASTAAGTPEEVEQFPRAIPGEVGSAVVG